MSAKKKLETAQSSEAMNVDSLAKSVEDFSLGEEDIMVSHSTNAADARFDEIIGHIEEIIMEPRFNDLQNEFMEKNYKHFEDSEENKLIYTNLHQEYLNVIEKYIENELIKRLKNFSMHDFMHDLMSRREELDGEIFEILITFEDFLEFKQLMLSYRASKEGRALDLTKGLSIQSVNFDTFRSSYAGVQSDLCISGTSKPSQNTTATTTTTTTTKKPSTTTTTSNNNKKNNSSTPLLDNTQIDSDHDHNEATPRMSIDQPK